MIRSSTNLIPILGSSSILLSLEDNNMRGPEPSSTEEDDTHHMKPNSSSPLRIYSSSLLDASFGTLVEDNDDHDDSDNRKPNLISHSLLNKLLDDSELEDLEDDHSYLLNLATAAGTAAAEAEGQLAEEEEAAAAEGPSVAVRDDDSAIHTGVLLDEKSCSHHDNSQAGEDTATTVETEDETQQDDDDDDQVLHEEDEDDISNEEDHDFSMTSSDLGCSQEEDDDFCHDQQQHENEGGTGSRLAFIFDMLPTGRGGGRSFQQSSSMGSHHDRLDRSMHAGIAEPAGNDALSKTIHGGACGGNTTKNSSRGNQHHQQHHMPPIQEKRPSSGGTTRGSRRSSKPSIGTVKKRVSDYEMKRSSTTSNVASSDCGRGRESYPPATTNSRGRPTLISPTSWGSRVRSSLSPVPGWSSSWGGTAALSPIRRGISPLRMTSNRSRNTTCCPRNSLGDYYLHPTNRQSTATIPLDSVDLDCGWGGGNDDYSFKTFNAMNMDHSAGELQRNISGSAFAMRSRFASADDGCFPTIREGKTPKDNNKRGSTTTTGQKINSFVENQFTTFAKNVDGMQEKFETMTTNIGETAQVIQEEPNSRVLGAVVQARMSCFADNLRHIRESTCFVRNLRTICGLPPPNNNSNSRDNSHSHHYGADHDDFDPFGDIDDNTDHRRLYSHQDKMY